MRFAVVGEGKTDYKILKNLLIGFFNNKNLPVTRLLPKENEPVGWGNVFKYLSTEEFRNGVENNDYIVVQIDTKECADWEERIPNIGSDTTRIDEFVQSVKNTLIERIGLDFYRTNERKIVFAITIHEIECWLLPFITTNKAHFSKMVGCENAVEKIANKQGFSIHQKNYQEGKHYDDLSQGMKNRKQLLEKSKLNPSLGLFINILIENFGEEQIQIE